MKINLSRYIILGLLFSGCSNISSIFQSKEQIYSNKIQPALQQLKTWTDGPYAEYESTLMKYIDDQGNIVENPDMNDYSIISMEGALNMFLNNPEYVIVSEGFDKGLKTYLAPAANNASLTGFDVMASLKAITPPNAVKTAHDQIVSCVEYRVELTAGISKSILDSYTVPNVLNQKDPCDLFEAATNNLETFINANQ